MKDNTRKTLKYYWQAAFKYKVSGFLSVASVVATSIIGVIVPLYFKQLFNLLVSAAPRDQIYAQLIGVLIIISAWELLTWLCWRVNLFALNYFETKAMADLYSLCFANLHKHSFAYFNNNFVGTLSKRINWFTRAFEAVVDQIIFNILPLIVSMLMIVIVLWRTNVWLSLGIMVWSVIFMGCAWIFNKFNLKYEIKRNEAESAVSGYLADTVTNNANVKLFNGYGREVAEFIRKTTDLARIKKFSWDRGAIYEAVQGLLWTLLELGIFFAAIRLWRQGKVTVGDFVLLQAYIIVIIEKVWSFSKILRVFYQNLSDAEEMTIILETPQEIQDIPRAKNLKVTKGEVVFNSVNFGYNESRMILKDFNLKVRQHERLAVIGPSGAGKTTIAKLIFRMHDINSGRILIDGQDIAKVKQESLWHNISLVPQDPILFHRTLKENIRYGKPEATDAEVFKAAKAANCHQFITSLEAGYDTYVGERGIKLSGGERQRVAIARAILRNAPILVLDEATSSLDSESEMLIQDALDKLMKSKTVIVIAHRLSTIRKMDRIIVVDDGRVVEEGTHQELAAKKEGIYRKLWQLQAGGFVH